MRTLPEILIVRVYGGITIDGAIYYGVENEVIVRFDVRTEKIELIQEPEESHITITYYSTLLNYNRELGGVDSHFSEEMRLWILEDGEKREWSNMTCALPSVGDDLLGDYVRSNGVIYAGEIVVIYPRFQLCKPFKLSVCYYDFRRKDRTKMVIPGIVDDELRRLLGIGKQTLEILSFLGYVENIRFL